MEQRVSLITLGVRDLARARTFYEALGWRTGAARHPVPDQGGPIAGLSGVGEDLR